MRVQVSLLSFLHVRHHPHKLIGVNPPLETQTSYSFSQQGEKASFSFMWSPVTPLFVDSQGRQYFHGFISENKQFFVPDIVRFSEDRIGQLCCFWETSDGDKMAEIRLFFRPCDLIGGRKPYHADSELIISAQQLTVPLSSLIQVVGSPTNLIANGVGKTDPPIRLK